MFRFVPNDLVDPSSSVGIIGIARRFIPPASFFRHFRRSRPRMMNALSTEGKGNYRKGGREEWKLGYISMGWEL